MSDLKNLYSIYIAALNGREFSALEKLIADDVRVNGVPREREAVIASLEGIADAFPDFVWTVQALLSEDGRIAARLHDTGTPVRQFLGHQPTGASFGITEYGSYQVRDGQFVDMWFLIDAAALGEQLRAKREPAASAI